MKRFTIADMLQMASLGDKDVLQYAEQNGRAPKVQALVHPPPPDVFPRYVPGSSCVQKGGQHEYYKRGERDICGKCGSSRRTRL